ncbi:hypothetical protein [uncultured Methanobrevibacter sp.]|uniref:hypothetical protein n=1 Tax=uncultured Methanobrevibacter sp. TaxID=253161 RepID=UPI0025CBACC3|nr:hypothetical protein [uncultured Methanobrevibacter sp.]
MEVKTCIDSPSIGDEIKEIIGGLSDIENYVLSLQLDYKDTNTLFYLKHLQLIEFRKDMLHIAQEKNCHVFISYENIVEYAVINAEDVINLGVI